ncbi:hypothetical protein A1355_04350 [Methylomonas koyamae]|uniref:Uncharacterized protein n=1 Tax=Methylomonas koyamae TaxID=702114 RepID=A0A177NNB9_9GAMM|nr:hypothetical protein A1355_04350 [Methylomonas koyamae]
MDGIQLLINVINKLPPYKLAALVVAFSVWMFGLRFLIKKHSQRLESENKEFTENIQLHLVSAKEWLVFTVFLITGFGLLVFAANL